MEYWLFNTESPSIEPVSKHASKEEAEAEALRLANQYLLWGDLQGTGPYGNTPHWYSNKVLTDQVWWQFMIVELP